MTKFVKFDAFVSGSDVSRLDPVTRCDFAYNLAAYEYDSNPRRTKVQELKLLRARAALRLACNVHVKSSDTGE